jgi:hypothetical protein
MDSPTMGLNTVHLLHKHVVGKEGRMASTYVGSWPVVNWPRQAQYVFSVFAPERLIIVMRREGVFHGNKGKENSAG